MWRIALFNYLLVSAALDVPLAGVYFWLGLPYRVIVACAAIPPLLFLSIRLVQAQSFVDVQLEQTLGNLSQRKAFERSGSPGVAQECGRVP